ncbi:MAG: FHA domain-containing protein [Gemmataceae bacterium]
MATDPVSIMQADATLTADEELPTTVPIRSLPNISTQDAIQLPPEEPTKNLRIARPAEPEAPAPKTGRRSKSSAMITLPAWRRPSQRPTNTPVGARLRLRVLRGQRINVEYPLYDGTNVLGRRDEEPIDIDLTEQEPGDRIWASRRHAVIHLHGGSLEIEDLHSRNGTFVNRTRLAPGSKRILMPDDVVQIGTIQMRVVV